MWITMKGTGYTEPLSALFSRVISMLCPENGLSAHGPAEAGRTRRRLAFSWSGEPRS